MADWTLIALDTPAAGSGQRTELSMASGRSMEFSLDSTDTLSFSLPGRHWQTTVIEPLTTDILVYRDDYCAQRFRVTGMDINKESESLKCSFTAVSYRELMNAWMFLPNHTRRFLDLEQTDIAWTILNESQVLPKGGIGMTRGTYPFVPVNRTLDGDWEATTPDPYYYEVGKRKGDAVQDIAAMVSGFEWDIEPDRTSSATERTGMKFNTWNTGLRQQHTPRCPFVLDDGGNITSWSRQSAPSEFANVIHALGHYPEGVGTADDPPPFAWAPPDMNPGGAAPEGRWERSVSTDAMSQDGIDAAAASELERSLAYQPAWSVRLAKGRWQGPPEMWIGDTCRLIVNDGPIDVDADARVVTLKIDVTDDGSEDIGIDLDRPARTYDQFRADLERRILDLEHR